MWHEEECRSRPSNLRFLSITITRGAPREACQTKAEGKCLDSVWRVAFSRQTSVIRYLRIDSEGERGRKRRKRPSSMSRMKAYISPQYTFEKLESPDYADIVDVFEDRMMNWLIEPAGKLLETQHGCVAAVGLLLSYFEGIEIYYSGKDSVRKSKEFFRRGFQRVFPAYLGTPSLFDAVTNALYDQVRCGFAHDGLFRNRVFFSEARPEALNVTWPKKNGIFDEQGELESVVINPRRFCESVRFHFSGYIDLLRQPDAQRKAGFLAAVNLKWALNESERLVAMSEDQFLKEA